MSWKIGIASDIICQRLVLRHWTVWLNSSCPPAYDHWYLDGHFLLVVQQRGVTAAGQGEMQAEVRHVNQMAWHLNTLPSGIPGLKDIKLDERTCPCITGGAGERWACLRCTK